VVARTITRLVRLALSGVALSRLRRGLRRLRAGRGGGLGGFTFAALGSLVPSISLVALRLGSVISGNVLGDAAGLLIMPIPAGGGALLVSRGRGTLRGTSVRQAARLGGVPELVVAAAVGAGLGRTARSGIRESSDGKEPEEE